MKRVMRCDNLDNKIYTPKELEIMFLNIPIITQCMLSDDKIKKYKDLTTEKKVIKKGTDDVCPICLDDLENDEELDYCKYSCGKHVHKNCFDIINKVNKKNKCVSCAGSWFAPKGKNNGEYINIS